MTIIFAQYRGIMTDGRKAACARYPVGRRRSMNFGVDYAVHLAWRIGKLGTPKRGKSARQVGQTGRSSVGEKNGQARSRPLMIVMTKSVP